MKKVLLVLLLAFCSGCSLDIPLIPGVQNNTPIKAKENSKMYASYEAPASLK